jgi:hypothetical protein
MIWQIPIKYLPVNKAVFLLNKIYLTIILISAKQNYFQETTFNSKYKAEYNSVKYFVDYKKDYFYFSILNKSFLYLDSKKSLQIPDTKHVKGVINQTWADNTNYNKCKWPKEKRQKTNNGLHNTTHKNKDNAKHGVSPRLKIWHCDLENQ